MRAFDEDNYKEAMDASFKVFAARGISKYSVHNYSMDPLFACMSMWATISDSLLGVTPIILWAGLLSGILDSSNMEEYP